MSIRLPNFRLLTAALALMIASSGLLAAEGPILVVPASPAVLHVDAPLPDRAALEAATSYRLVEIDATEVAIAATLVTSVAADGTAASSQRVVASIPPRESASGCRRFRLEPADAPGDGAFRFDDASEKSVGLWDGEQPVLVYNYGVITREEIPENEPRRSRSSYIHPLYGLRGEVLTDDFPRDHYHHHGVFWTWPHVGIDGQEYDIWADRGIRQQFVSWLGRDAGFAGAALGVENGWFVGDKKVMVERVWMRAFKSAGQTRAIDLELVWIPVEKPVTLWGAEGKSYGGLTVRFAVPSEKDSTITVPAGRTTADLPDTPLVWADLTAKMKGADAPSGGAVFVPPSHPDFPPTWLTRHYGPLCIGWPGVKPKTFQPGEVIRLEYRLWLHNDLPEVAAIQAAYDGYVAARTAHWE